MMKKNQIFAAFLKMVAPAQARAFKKKADGEGYETYEPIKKTGHKFVFDGKKNIIFHTYYVYEYGGFEYRKEPVTEEIRILPTENGFRAIKV